MSHSNSSQLLFVLSDCGFGGQLANGSIEVGSEEDGQVVAMVTCDDGFDATRDIVTCTISENSVKRDEVMCREQEDDSALIIIIIISIICITIGVIIIISCPVLILWIVWLIKYKKHTAYVCEFLGCVENVTIIHSSIADNKRYIISALFMLLHS